MTPTGDNKRLSTKKNLKGKPKDWDVHRGFEQFWHILECLDGHTDVQGCKHGQEGPKRVLISHLWTWDTVHTFDTVGYFYFLVKAIAELQIYWWSIEDIPPNTQRAPG